MAIPTACSSGNAREVVARDRALLEQRTPRRVAAQQPNGAVTGPERERLGLVQRLVVAGPGDLQHGVGADRRDVGVAGERERLAELEAPLGRDRLGDRLQLREVGQLVHPGTRVGGRGCGTPAPNRRG